MGQRRGGWATTALLFLAACSGKDSGGGDGGSGGGAADAADGTGDNDASGGVEDASADSGATDSGVTIDSGATVDAGPGPVTVTFAFPSVPREGVDVFFLRADGSVIDVAVTDENGRAQAWFDEDGIVVLHFLIGDEPQDSVFAYLSVPPGASIFHGFGPARDLTGTLTVNGPTYPGATAYGVTTTCGSGMAVDPTVNISLAFCSPRTHLLWTAYGPGDEGFVPLAGAFAPEVEIAAGTVTMTGPVLPVVEQTTRITGIPDDARPTFMNYAIVGPIGLVQVGSENYEDTLPIEDGSTSIVDTFHDLRQQPGVNGLVAADIFRAPASVMQFYGRVEHDGTPTLAVGDLLIPWVLDPQFDRRTGTWRWVEEGGGSAAATYGLVGVQESPRTKFWQVIAPHGATELTLPRLPEPFDYLNIEPTSNVTGFRIHLLDRMGGYQRFLSDYHLTTAAGYHQVGEAPGDTLIFSY
jgi:hypothetical protein